MGAVVLIGFGVLSVFAIAYHIRQTRKDLKGLKGQDQAMGPIDSVKMSFGLLPEPKQSVQSRIQTRAMSIGIGLTVVFAIIVFIMDWLQE